MLGSRYIWGRIKEERSLAYAWLAWLERAVPDPLAQPTNPAQVLVHVALISPHPDLNRILHGEPLTGEEYDRIERWIADFAVRLDYPASEPWRNWMSRRRTPAR
jgi:hypothetical protein